MVRLMMIVTVINFEVSILKKLQKCIFRVKMIFVYKIYTFAAFSDLIKQYKLTASVNGVTELFLYSQLFVDHFW